MSGPYVDLVLLFVLSVFNPDFLARKIEFVAMGYFEGWFGFDFAAPDHVAALLVSGHGPGTFFKTGMAWVFLVGKISLRRAVGGGANRPVPLSNRWICPHRML